MSRYYHTFPYQRKRSHASLFNEEDKAKLAYNRDLKFQLFANELHNEMPELSLKDLYIAYKNGNVIQLRFAL